MLKFGNVITAMVTPFYENGNIDFDEFDSLARYLLENGSDGLLVAGTTGEGATLTEEERLRLFRFAADEYGDRTMIMANVGSNNTAATVEFAKKAEKTGVDCLLVIVPYYNKPNQDGCYAHFAAVAKAVSLPVIIYNVPGRTGGKILPETVVRLAADFPNIVGIKEASGDLVAATKIARDTKDDFCVYSGEDALTLPITAVGGTGVISVASHIIGKEMNAIVQCCKNGDMEAAASINQKYLDVMTGIFTTVNPIPVKECCQMLKITSKCVFRMPMVNASDEVKKFLDSMMKKAGLYSRK